MIKTYNDIQIDVRWQTPGPGQLIREALDMTMKREPRPFQTVSKKTLEFLFSAEHQSIVEHAVMCFVVKNASRSFLAQITRHRLASYTSASQHYQDYRDYPDIIHPTYKDNETFEFYLDQSTDGYKDLVTNGVPKEEARQVLPNSKAVNLMMTMNAASLYNLFRKRMCLRNVTEMVTFTYLLWVKVFNWWPDLARIIGPPCYLGKCNQGHMACGKTFVHPYKELV